MAPVTLRAAAGANVIIAGSVVVNAWAPEPGMANVYATSYSETATLDGSEVGIPQQVFIDGAPLQQIGTSNAHPACTTGLPVCMVAVGSGLADLLTLPGSFWFDKNADRLLADGDRARFPLSNRRSAVCRAHDRQLHSRGRKSGDRSGVARRRHGRSRRRAPFSRCAQRRWSFRGLPALVDHPLHMP